MEYVRPDAAQWKQVGPKESEWCTVTRSKKGHTSGAVVSRVEVETAADRLGDRCTEGHAECAESPEKLCVYKLRRRIKCAAEFRSSSGCAYGETCYFEHSPAPS